MRIAFSGAHGVGKTTLIADVHRIMNGHQVTDEPYYHLLDEGHSFSDRPSVEDFQLQLERSVAMMLSDAEPDILYDRCPADFLAYLTACDAPDVVGEWLPASEEALDTLDLIVFVPIEMPDRISDIAAHDSLRHRVDAALHELLLEDGLGINAPVVTVQGSATARVQQVLDRMKQ